MKLFSVTFYCKNNAVYKTIFDIKNLAGSQRDLSYAIRDLLRAVSEEFVGFPMDQQNFYSYTIYREGKENEREINIVKV